jgi:hypothetical protein
MPLIFDNQTFYNTQEACRLAGTNRFTFLRWVKLNKFNDVECRDRNGWRLFSEDDLQRLKEHVNHIERISVKKYSQGIINKTKIEGKKVPDSSEII